MNYVEMAQRGLTFFVGAGFGGLVIQVLNNWYSGKSRREQNNYEYSKIILPVLLEIVEDLETLECAFRFKGGFCPMIEHRSPELSNKDGNELGKMSYAQRTFQFKSIGLRIRKNCRRVIYLTPKLHLPGIVDQCNLIIFYLDSQGEKSGATKNKLDLLLTQLLGIMSGRTFEQNSDYFQQVCLEHDEFVKQLRNFREELDIKITSELPNYGK